MLSLCLSACVIALALGADIKEDNGVLILTTANFDDAIKENPNLLVEFCKYLSDSKIIHVCSN